MSAGIVGFSWRPAPRAARYTLMVDRRRMNTGCATRAAMLVGAGSHSYRVIAQNRYGNRSSRSRVFSATRVRGSVNRIPVRGHPGRITFTPSLRVAVGPAEKARARAAVRLIAGCDYSYTVNFNEGGPTPTRVDFSVDAECKNGILSSPGRPVAAVQAYIVNSRNVRVSGIGVCLTKSAAICRAHGIYRPELANYTRQLGLRARLVFFKRRSINFPGNKQALKECHKTTIGTPVLICTFTVRFITLDHRCDLTPVRRSSLPPQSAVPATELYPSNQTPLLQFVDGRGRVSRLFWGKAKEVKGPAFFDGFGYRHIAKKHGFGPADEQATRNAIRGRPVTTEKVKVKKQSFIKRIYEGSRYTQNATNCLRVVVINYPPRSSTGGPIITSYRAVVGEPGSDLPSQG